MKGVAVRELDEATADSMAKLPIIVAPDPRLKQRAKAVDRVDAEIRRLMDDMLDSHARRQRRRPRGAPGRRAEAHHRRRHGRRPTRSRGRCRMANPEIVWASDEIVCCEEGCLSLPEQYAEVTRPARGPRPLSRRRRTRSANWTPTACSPRCIQHEMDHLEGTLFVDHCRRSSATSFSASSPKPNAWPIGGRLTGRPRASAAWCPR